MRYISTRGVPTDQPRTFTEILLAGLAPDGGLYMPVEYPQVDADTLLAWSKIFREEGYAALAFEVMRLYIDDIPEEDLREMCRRAYSVENFGSREVAPMTQLSDHIWLLHLSNGPTAAFKDMAMQMLGQLFEYTLGKSGQELNILGATSGDTGSSAEYAMLGKAGIRVFMLTPAGRMTPFQQAQMYGIDDPAIVNIALDGVFDDCQDVVKTISADSDFKTRYSIGAVNSINWARLLAQVVYYVAAWIQASGTPANKVSFSVPTGNFGDVFAGHVARSMGVPIDRLIVATNENNVLDEFYRTGIYRVRSSEQTFKTSSPSMDISKASNFERFVFDLVERDQARVRELFVNQLGARGEFSLAETREFKDARRKFGFLSGSSTHADRIDSIQSVYRHDRVLIDPHTADAWKVARDALRGGAVEQPLVVLETALPVKFAETIEEALGITPEVPERFVSVMDAGRHVVDLPNDPEAVKALIREVVDG
ncbi:threonine synthase [Actinomyces sp.]|uniref:threonine synthase n=1 Tax=Actinomyces sp. TaxID=29317 RepID=UPI00290DB630|nr:threonine synthase [Actinomyces sp.]MDU5231728.1 threonine synthase [Actinomyces sp.]MDU6757326.1 threonine synthase [Actinomyces sp.]